MKAAVYRGDGRIVAEECPRPVIGDGEVFGAGCPDNININVFGAISNGEAVVNFVESLEDGDDPVNCADDQNRPTWLAVIR
ncbi:MAG: hypothetical protein AAB387_07980, partial [candidate division NC10 bacterium]